MKLFWENIKPLKSLTISFNILDVRMGSKYASAAKRQYLKKYKEIT